MTQRLLLYVSVAVMWIGIWRDVPIMAYGGAVGFITYEVLKFLRPEKQD